MNDGAALVLVVVAFALLSGAAAPTPAAEPAPRQRDLASELRNTNLFDIPTNLGRNLAAGVGAVPGALQGASTGMNAGAGIGGAFGPIGGGIGAMVGAVAGTVVGGLSSGTQAWLNYDS